MASLMGVAFMLSSLGTISAESGGEQNNPDKICYYKKKKCPKCEGGTCEKDPDPEGDLVPYKVSNGKKCPTDPVEAGLDDSYEFDHEEEVPKTRSLRSGVRAAQPVRLAGGFSPNLVNPKNLKVFGDGAEVVRDADTNVRQIKGDTGFMDAVYTAETKTLELRFYKPADIKPGKVNGVYQIKDGVTSLHVVRYVQEEDNTYREERIDNSAASPSVKSHKVTQTVGPEPYTVTHTKTYLHGEGLSAVEYRRATNKITAIPNGEPQEEKYLCMVEELGSDGQWHVTERKAGRRATYKEEDGAVPLYECNAVNEDGTPMNPIATETTYTYYSDPLVPASYGKVRTLRRNDGYWENKYYDENASAGLEMTRTESPWLNTAAHEPGEAPQGQIRVKSETRCNTDTGIEDITEVVGGITIAKEWTEKSRADQQKVKLVRHQPHSGGDKITTTVRYRNAQDIPAYLRGKTVSVHHADGSMSLYSYALNEQNLTVTKDTGYGAGNSVNHGTRTVSIQDKDSGKLKEEVRYALEGGQAHWLGSKTGVQFDNAGTCMKWVYDNNPDDYTEQRKDCCHVTWEKGRDGIESTYTYDAQGRKTVATSRGITFSTEYRGLTTIQWKQAKGSSQKYLVGEVSRNLAGQTVEEKSPIAGGKTLATQYEEDIAARTKATHTPYGTASTRLSSADHQLLSETGTTGITQNYTYTPTAQHGGGLVVTVTDGNRSRTETTDLLNHTVAEQSGGNALTQYAYDAAGRITQTVLPDGEKQLHVYENEVQISGLDLNGDGALTAAIDRMEKSERVFDSSWPEDKGSWKTVTSRAWQGSWQPVSLTWTTEDGTKTRNQTPGTDGYAIQEHPPVSAQGNSHTVSESSPDGQVQERVYTMADGHVTSTTSTWKDGRGQVVSTEGKTFDSWGNMLTQTDGRTGTTAYSYDDGTGEVLNQTMPDQSVVSYQYDDYGRRVTTVFPDGTEQHQDYDTEGRIIRQWGSQQYPVSYEYDAYGQKTGMTTYRVPVGDAAAWPEGAEGDKTTWSYDAATGNLLQKTYADGRGMSYTYTPGGKLKTETNARGNVTTYSHDAAGRQIAVQVNDNGLTPTKTFSYDQLDRQVSAATEGVASYQYIYNDQDQVTEEQITIPTVNGNLERSLVRAYDSHGRPTGYQLKNGDTVEQTFSYTYTPTGQLAGVSADGKEFTYDYLPNAPHLISQMTAPVHTVTHTYVANRDMLISKINRWKNKVDNPIISAYTYTVNSLGQRTSVSTEGEAFGATPADWAWGYDVLGQVASANEDHYSYDQIGNRRTSRKGDAPDTVYTANALNQYSRIGATTPTHDADGNQLTGLAPTTTVPARDTLSFTYNAENRPVQITQNGEVRESYTYDHMGRRIHKGDTVTLYDGYNAIAEYKSNTRTLKTTYAWGHDLSGTAQGAGGVGGLLSVTEHDRQLPLTSYPCYDGNGNITEYLTEEGTGTIAAHYEYDAFGQVSRKTGNRDYGYQFSTKPYDSLTGLLYYNYRHYDPSNGRWISRDPIAEQGGWHLYGMAGNNTIAKFDNLGLKYDDLKAKFKDYDSNFASEKLPDEFTQSFNCAGLATRTFVFLGLEQLQENYLSKGKAIGCSEKCEKCQIKFWVWQYQITPEVNVNGKILKGETAQDFHVVAGKVSCEDGSDLKNVFSKNGKRPMIGPNLGSSFKPKDVEIATENTASAKPFFFNTATNSFTTQRTEYIVLAKRENMKENCYCLDANQTGGH